MKKYSIIFFVLWMLILTINVQAQPDAVHQIKQQSEGAQAKQPKKSVKDQRFYRMAQSYLNKSRYNLAISILEDLCKRNPQNLSYYKTLLRAYFTISKIQGADSLVLSMKKRYPTDPQIDIDYANVQYRKGEKKKALELWNLVIKNQPGQLNIYTQVASAMTQNRLLEEAIEVYLRAISNIPKSEFLYQNIASLYQNRLMYIKAAKYYLKYLENNPKQRQYIFNRILTFQMEPEQQDNLFKMLKNITKESKISEDILLLTAQLYQRYGYYENAYKVYQKLEVSKSQGNYLLQFARAAERDSSFRIALDAYTEVIKKYPGYKKIMQAYKGAVTTLFSLAETEENSQYANRAILIIDSVKARFPNRPDLAEMLYLKGLYYLDYYFDVDRAMRIFTEIINHPGYSRKQKNMALLKLGECYIIKGQLDSALSIYNRILTKPHTAIADLQTARIYYYLKDWNKANEILSSIIQKEGMASDLTNDALALQLKIEQAQGAPAALNLMADADLLFAQRKKGEAIEKLANIVKINSVPGSLKSEAYRQLILNSEDLGKNIEALDFCNNAIIDSSMVQYADEYLFLMANILEKQSGQAAEAFKLYQQLLENYPNSLYANHARERMNYLREYKLQELP